MKPMAEETAPPAESMRARRHTPVAENATVGALQAALDSATAHFPDLHAPAPAASCTICAQGLILQANRAATALLGVTQRDPIDQAITQFVVDAALPMFEQYCRQVLQAGDTPSCEPRMVDADRRQFVAHLQSTVAPAADGALQLRILLTDIMPRTAPHAAGVGHGTDRADLAESLLRAKIRHDLRQPLSALGIYAHVLKSHVAPAGQPLLAQLQLCLATLSELLAE